MTMYVHILTYISDSEGAYFKVRVWSGTCGGDGDLRVEHFQHVPHTVLPVLLTLELWVM